jgi:hypothetical protein
VYQAPAVMPAASPRMSLRLSAISRSSSIDSSRLRRSARTASRCRVKGAVEQLILSAHAPAHRRKIRYEVAWVRPVGIIHGTCAPLGRLSITAPTHFEVTMGFRKSKSWC